jgi:mRNA interferase MazF
MSGGADDAGKPRPVLIVRSDDFDNPASLTICPLTSDATEAEFIRIPVEPGPTNGLKTRSNIMIDKVTTVPVSKMGTRIGGVNARELAAVNLGLLVYLGLAS